MTIRGVEVMLASITRGQRCDSVLRNFSDIVNRICDDVERVGNQLHNTIGKIEEKKKIGLDAAGSRVKYCENVSRKNAQDIGRQF